MKISEFIQSEFINNNDISVKLSDRSMTVKYNGKTKAVINDITKYLKLQSNKTMPIWTKIKNLTGEVIPSAIRENLYVDNDENLYFPVNSNSWLFTDTRAEEFFPEEIERHKIKMEYCKKAGINILMINYH